MRGGRTTAKGLCVCFVYDLRPESDLPRPTLPWRPAQGILLVYDVTDRNSFDSIENWVRQMHTVRPRLRRQAAARAHCGVLALWHDG